MLQGKDWLKRNPRETSKAAACGPRRDLEVSLSWRETPGQLLESLGECTHRRQANDRAFSAWLIKSAALSGRARSSKNRKRASFRELGEQ